MTNPVNSDEEGWPQCESCGHHLYDFTPIGMSWYCINPECEEFDGWPGKKS